MNTLSNVKLRDIYDDLGCDIEVAKGLTTALYYMVNESGIIEQRTSGSTALGALAVSIEDALQRIAEKHVTLSQAVAVQA